MSSVIAILEHKLPFFVVIEILERKLPELRRVSKSYKNVSYSPPKKKFGLSLSAKKKMEVCVPKFHKYKNGRRRSIDPKRKTTQKIGKSNSGDIRSTTTRSIIIESHTFSMSSVIASFPYPRLFLGAQVFGVSMIVFYQDMLKVKFNDGVHQAPQGLSVLSVFQPWLQRYNHHFKQQA
jgi:hypothetical protein